MLKRSEDEDGDPSYTLISNEEVEERVRGFWSPGIEKMRVGGSLDLPPLKPFEIVICLVYVFREHVNWF